MISKSPAYGFVISSNNQITELIIPYVQNVITLPTVALTNIIILPVKKGKCKTGMTYLVAKPESEPEIRLLVSHLGDPSSATLVPIDSNVVLELVAGFA